MDEPSPKLQPLPSSARGGGMGQQVATVAVIGGLVLASVWGLRRCKADRERDLAELELQQHSFSGIEVSLPKGTFQLPTNLYENGEAQVLGIDGRGGSAGLSWSLEEALAPRTFVSILEGKVGEMKTVSEQEITVAGATGQRGVYQGKKGSIVVSSFPCGSRGVLVYTTFRRVSDDHLALHERIVDSVRCTDDEERATRLFYAPDLEVPEGFGYNGDPEDVVFISLDGEALSFFLGEADLAKKILADPVFTARAFERGAGFEHFEFVVPPERAPAADGSERPLWKVELRDDEGDDGFGMFSTWPCEGGRYGIMVFYFAQVDTSLEVARKALLSARCPGPDSRGVEAYPTQEAVFAAACEAGDERGCPEEEEEEPAAD